MLGGLWNVTGAADDDDNVEGWTDEMNFLSPSEREHIREETRPVKLILVKVIYVKFMKFCIDSFKRLCLRWLTHQQLSCPHGEDY